MTVEVQIEIGGKFKKIGQIVDDFSKFSKDSQKASLPLSLDTSIANGSYMTRLKYPTGKPDEFTAVMENMEQGFAKLTTDIIKHG